MKICEFKKEVVVWNFLIMESEDLVERFSFSRFSYSTFVSVDIFPSVGDLAHAEFCQEITNPSSLERQ